jgi:hypothetical protein
MWLEGVIDELFERSLEKQIEDGDLDGWVDPDTKKPYQPHCFHSWTGRKDATVTRTSLEFTYTEEGVPFPDPLWVILDLREGTVYLNGRRGTVGEARMLDTNPLRR